MRKFSQLTPDEDTPLLLSLHRGDLSAFETLVWKYQKRVFNLAMLLTGVEKTACKVVENSFITAFQEIRSLKSTVRFSSWLISHALRECRELEDSREPALAPGIEEELIDEESYSAAVQRRLELCIRQLPFELSELIILRYVRGFSLERINEILQIGEGLLLARLFEAQETLACWLRSDTENLADLCGIRPKGVIHPEIRRNFSAYLDSSVEGVEKDLTKDHLKSCGSCREALAELEWMVEDIKSIPDVEPPPWIASAIMEKIKGYTDKPVEVKSTAGLKIKLAVAAVILGVIAVSAYQLLRTLPPAEESAKAAKLMPDQKTAEPSRVDGITSIVRGMFKGHLTAPVNRPETDASARPLPPVPSPPLPSTAEPLSQGAPLPRPAPPVETVKDLPAQKSDKPETPSPLLQEWGDSLPQTRIPQKKVEPAMAKGGDIEIVLSSVASAGEIDSAVTSVGGRINGRAYSGGSDILFARVEVDRVSDLLNRLGKVGKIQELPQIPDGTEGGVDLIIKW